MTRTYTCVAAWQGARQHTLIPLRQRHTPHPPYPLAHRQGDVKEATHQTLPDDPSAAPCSSKRCSATRLHPQLPAHTLACA
jgi:hypothetical protein